jgi:hypothetical protein
MTNEAQSSSSTVLTTREKLRGDSVRIRVQLPLSPCLVGTLLLPKLGSTLSQVISEDERSGPAESLTVKENYTALMQYIRHIITPHGNDIIR